MTFHQIALNDAIANLSQLCDRVVDDRDIVIITRSDGEKVALIAADELSSLMETAHLLRSPKNAERLLTALQNAKLRTLEPKNINDLYQELDIGEER
ncbi:MAG: type II toxin-antitoxin system prevent-host-death family antitoxin [Limnoraphis sp.]